MDNEVDNCGVPPLKDLDITSVLSTFVCDYFGT
jgi:hypothetical protein